MARKATSKPGTCTSQSSATIGKTVDDAIIAIERDKGVLSKDYTRRSLDTVARCLAVMNIALRVIKAVFGMEYADTFRNGVRPA